MFESGKVYTNRYSDKYYFEKIDDPIQETSGELPNDIAYCFHMDGDSMRYCRYGGKEGQDEMDFDDLGMFDPSGGPYITVGTEIDGNPITKIGLVKNFLIVSCKK